MISIVFFKSYSSRPRRSRRRPRGLRELLDLPQSMVTTIPFFRLSTNLLLSSLLTVHSHLPLHSCSGSGNSFVDITSNQAQPLSNFLLIQPDQRHLQILIEVQLEDYSPPPLPNPPNLANEGGRTLLYQQGTRPSTVWTWVTKINTSRLLELC